MTLTSVCESPQNYDRENQKKQCCYIKSTGRWYLDLVVNPNLGGLFRDLF